MDVQRFLKELDALLGKEAFPEAKAFLYAALNECEKEKDVLSKISVYNEIMGFERQWGENEAAINAANASISLLEQTGMSVSRPAAMIYLNAATVYKNAGNTPGAKELYETAEKLFLRYYSPNDKETAGLYNNMASVYLDPNNYPKAEYYYQRALSILTRAGDVCDAAVTYMNLAGLEKNRLNEKQALLYAEEAKRLMDVPDEKRDGYYRYTCRKCVSACKEMGMPEMAAHFEKQIK
ncbi:MAG: tetratricopeptide repeat protein [Clostridia bacterium]|nr:tetratricopeptide repeat protein [Clostridia bacterium]